MAQTKVTDFFAQNKRRGNGLNSIKRLKEPTSEQIVGSVPSHSTPKSQSGLPLHFDLSSALFTPTNELSSRKRRRLASVEERQGGDGRSARKKLLLDVDKSESLNLLSSPCLKEDKSSTPSVDKALKNQINKSGSSSPTISHNSKPQTASQTPEIKEDTTELKARLQRIQELTRKVKVPAAKESISLKDRLKRVQELQVKLQEKAASEVNGPCIRETERDAEQSEKAPAYQRFHTLAQDLPPGLALPYKYKVLAEMFRSMDTIVGMLFNRSETITFAKVKQGVQDMMRKQFEERNVGQIKTVYSTAYRFRQEKNIPTFIDGMKKSSYQLTVEPVVDENIDGRPHLSATRLLERRLLFSRNLVNIVKQHHKAFLNSLSPPMNVPDDQLTRWHPRFKVDEVPDVIPADLPRPPHVEQITTAQEVLNRARSLMSPKMEKALANIALKTAETCAGEAKDVLSKALEPGQPATTSITLKGVSPSLLERIRAKEAQKMQAMMTRNSQQEERLLMMYRLSDMARILRNVFVSEKKPALIMEIACNRVITSYSSTMPSSDMEKHLRLLSEIVPDWLSIHPVRKDTYVKLNKNVDLGAVLEKLSKKIKEEEKL
ncbi:DNA replication factor Cdt1 isoform X2 [Protopterus annectens]|uniref:DNA replication factor Cdt1 isoform X2 n=1 Tax=Protopterus annectens TaxID=7888 RepID=UPI001CF99281|nr:DNA replication factor Cdt1 isoform X2 [Protopterus annectens]